MKSIIQFTKNYRNIQPTKINCKILELINVKVDNIKGYCSIILLQKEISLRNINHNCLDRRLDIFPKCRPED